MDIDGSLRGPAKDARLVRRALPGAADPLGLCLLLLLSACLSTPAADASAASTNNSPSRATVVAVEDANATEAFSPRPDRIQDMVSRAVIKLTGKPAAGEAWKSLLATHTPFSSNDVVGIKVFSLPGPNSGTRPAVAAAVVEGLLAAGVPPKHIVVWDRQSITLRLAGYYDFASRYGIRVMSSAQTGYDEKASYDHALIGNLVWGDLEFGRKGDGVGRKSYVSKLVSRDITRIINITPLLNHNQAGVCGNLYSLALGSVDNTLRFEAAPDRLATAVPEIFALPALSDHVVLNITDALVCQYEGSERGLLHYSAVLNQLWFSRDPVALDVLSLKELDHQRELAKAPAVKANLELYSNAALLELGVNDTRRIQIER